MRRLALTLTLALACAAGLSACGSSKPDHKHSSSGYDKQYAAARCMRAHGVPNFPDPGSDGGNPVAESPGSDTITIAGIPFSGPAFVNAEKRCDPLGLGSSRPPISEHQKEQLIAFAECMRHHGLTRWADPLFPPSGGIEQVGQSAYNRDDPKVLAASAACNKAN
jgi:hypothetical protein